MREAMAYYKQLFFSIWESFLRVSKLCGFICRLNTLSLLKLVRRTRYKKKAYRLNLIITELARDTIVVADNDHIIFFRKSLSVECVLYAVPHKANLPLLRY